MSKLKFRIKEVVTEDGRSVFYPQYKCFGFWRTIREYTPWDSFKVFSGSYDGAVAICRAFQKERDAVTVVKINYEDVP